jgi:signal transduction histidine kinase
MKQTPRRRLQDRATLLLALSSVFPTALFLIFGFWFLNSLFLKKDVNNLKRFAQTVKQIEEKRVLLCLQDQRNAARQIREPKNPWEARRVLDELARENPEMENYYVNWDGAETHNRFSLSHDQLNILQRQADSIPENGGYLILEHKKHILTYTRLDSLKFHHGLVLVLWRYTMPENLYISSLIKINTIGLDNEQLLKGDDPESHRIRELFLRINETADGVYVHKDSNLELTSFYFVRDIFGQPIAIQSMTTERFFIQQLLLSFWIGGLLIAFAAIISAIYMSRKAANYLLNPMENLSRQMNRIASDPVHSDEIPSEQFAPLDLVVSSFNGILHSFKQYYDSVRKYETIVTNIREGIFWADGEGKLIIYNKAFLDIFEVQQREAPYSLMEMFGWKTQDFSLHAAEFFKGKEIPVEDKTYLLFITEMDVRGQTNFLGLISDLTQLKDFERSRRQLELQLSKAQELANIGLLIEGISHNLNGPLHNILGYVQLMQEVYPNSTDLKKIRQNGLRMAEIIKSLMNRMTQVVVFAPRPVDINELVRLELDFFEHNLTFKNQVDKQIALGDNLPRIVVVYSDVSQSISNLISNAIDAVDEMEDKRIAVTTALTERGLRVSVADNGSGIPSDKLDMIFEPFYSSKRLETRSGRGLGLSISKQLLAAYGAWIEVESRVGLGSRFTVIFPPTVFAKGGEGAIHLSDTPPEI